MLLLGMLAGVSCSDWTENEKIGVEDPVIGQDDPELYARYLASLRTYKQGNHRHTIVWFDNSDKQPSSRGGFFSDVPDSVDIVALTAAGRLGASELEQVKMLHGKGTRVIGAVDCTALLAEWNAAQRPGTIAEEGGVATGDGFATWLREVLAARMSDICADRLDGLTICYEPTDPTFMTEDELKTQRERDAVVTEFMTEWKEREPDGLLLFEGNPQHLSDKSVLGACDFVVVRCLDAASVYDFGSNAFRMSVEGVPADRFVWLVSAVPAGSTDTGYVTDAAGEFVRATTALAEWLLLPGELVKAGIGIMDVQYDYYNSMMIYRYTKEAIETLNPSPKN